MLRRRIGEFGELDAEKIADVQFAPLGGFLGNSPSKWWEVDADRLAVVVWVEVAEGEQAEFAEISPRCRRDENVKIPRAWLSELIIL